VYVNKKKQRKINHEFKNVVVSHKALIEADIEVQEIIGQLQKDKY
jgi:small subunit ribosomal protein S1